MEQPKRRILFVTPPYHCGVVEVAGSWPPLAFLYLGAQAEKAGWEAQIYDAMTLREDYGDITKFLRRTAFDVLATTAITPTFPDAARLCQVAKSINPSCITLIGGVHPTFCAEEIFAAPDNAIDYIIAGEGELPLHEFLVNFDDVAKRNQTSNLMYPDDESVTANPVLPLNDDLDTLPTSWDLLNWKDYKYYVIPDSILGAVSTSRGCNHGCTFCSQQRFWNKMWRGRSPESVVAEMRHAHDTYGVNVFLFTDEYPTYDRDRWEALLDRIIAEDLNSHILMETRVEDIVRDEAILPKYRKAGIIHVYVGAEATDQKTLDRINKDNTVLEARHAIELIARHHMISETSFVLGFPEDTEESIEKTFELSREFNPDFAHYLAITPWPYSEFHEEVKDSIEVTDYRRYNLIDPIIRPDSMTRDRVDHLIVDCYRRFYMPKMLEFRKIEDAFRREYILRSMKLIMKSSFLIGKFARLGLDPRKMMRDVLGV